MISYKVLQSPSKFESVAGTLRFIMLRFFVLQDGFCSVTLCVFGFCFLHHTLLFTASIWAKVGLSIFLSGFYTAWIIGRL